MNFVFRALCILSLFVLSNSAFSQVTSLAVETSGKIDALFDQYKQGDKRGSIMSVVKNGAVVYTNKMGFANLENQDPIRNTSVFNIASNSKQFTMFLALILEEEGKLALDDDIRLYLPELKHLPNKISIRQLANHTHGLPNVDELLQAIGRSSMNREELLDVLLSIENACFLPGEQHFYNNTGFVLLSLIIERAGGSSFEKQLQEKVLTPLKMNNTKVLGEPNILVQDLAHSYTLVDSSYSINPVTFSTMGASGVYTSIEDLNLWVKNFQNTTVGKKAFYETMQGITTLKSGQKTNYGLGFQCDRYKGIDVVFHGGGTGSYRSYILHAPAHQLSLVFLSNKGGMSGLDIMYGSLDILLQEFIQEEESFSVLKGEALEKLEGSYEVYPGKYFNFVVENDKLYFQFLESKEKYHFPQIGEDSFDYPAAHHKISFYDGGLILHQADMDYFCPKTDFKWEALEDLNLDKYVGTYTNKLYNTSYELVIKKGQLVAVHSNNDYDIVLSPLEKDCFYSGYGYFSRIDFTSNGANRIESFQLSGQNINKLSFTRVD